MDPTTITIIGFIAVFPMLALGVPVAFALAIVGIVGLIVLNGLGPMMSVFGQLPYTTVANYSYLVIPLFVLAGAIADHSKFMEDMFWAVRQWLGHISGGLAIVTVVACGVFAAISGSSIAATATMSRMAIS